jgi:hypothetical protein
VKKEKTMKTYIRYGVAAIALLAGINAATAAGTGAGPRWLHPASASDSLRLSSAQKQTIFQTVFNGNERNEAPAGFTASIGQTLPSSVTARPLPSDVASQVPAVRGYSYATVEKGVLIVNPADKKVVDIIRSE